MGTHTREFKNVIAVDIGKPLTATVNVNLGNDRLGNGNVVEGNR